MTNNYAILDIASKRHEDFLYNMYRWRRTPSTRATATTGRSIRSGSRRRARRSRPRRPARRAAARTSARAAAPAGGGAAAGGGAPIAIYNSVLHDPKMRDPRGFILPSDQPDFLTATKFVNILIKAGVVRPPRDGAVHGRRQAVSRRFVRRQGGAAVPRAPDGHVRAAGSSRTTSVSRRRAASAVRRHRLQHRLLDGHQVRPHPRRLRRSVREDSGSSLTLPPGKVAQAPSGGGYLLSHEVNDAFVAVNRLLKANEEVDWTQSAVQRERQTYRAGTMYIPAKASTAGGDSEGGGRQGRRALMPSPVSGDSRRGQCPRWR